MTRVGFVLEGPTFQGSVNYFRNLFSALALLPDRPIEPVVFVGTQVDDTRIAAFADASVIRTALLDERTFASRVRRRIKRMFDGRDPLLAALLKRHRIGLLSHSGTLRGSTMPTAGWIPDFQHAHLPSFFDDDERALRDADFRALADQCDCIVVSSEAALGDLAAFAPDALAKSAVLRFVPAVDQTAIVPLSTLEVKYAFRAPFFYVPNQFWIHKNHVLVVDALALLKQRGLAPIVVMTGSTADYRHPDHFESLMKRAEAAGVSHSLRVLGTVPYADLISLMQHAVAIVNPSLFEGWSSSVEEAKALDKIVLLSSLPVHREQAPAKGRYFDPTRPEALADAMRSVLEGPLDDTSHVTTPTLSATYVAERERFARTYVGIVDRLVPGTAGRAA